MDFEIGLSLITSFILNYKDRFCYYGSDFVHFTKFALYFGLDC